MIVLEFKLKGKAQQYRVIDEMIRTAQFVRNKALRYWMDNQGVKLSDLYKQCAVLAKEFEWAGKLNSMARQASAERAIFAIQRFYSNCKANKSGKKGYPQFKKFSRCVEYKTSGWKLSSDKKHLTFIDGFAAGRFKLVGSRDLHFQWLQYLGKVYGKTVVAVAPQYTSQDCSTCGTTVKKSLSVRTHVCECGTVLDRDHNAALNILAKALRQAGINLNTEGHSGINACGQTDLYSLVVTSTSKPTG